MDNLSNGTCAECGSIATCRCVKCECVMCFTCFEQVHKASKYLKNHQLELLGSSVEESDVKWCSEHQQKKIEFFCEDDNMEICSYCVVKGEHRSHQVCTLEERDQNILKIIGPRISNAKLAVKQLIESEEKVQVQLHALQSKKKQTESEIKEYFNKLHKLIERREIQLQSELTDKCNEKMSKLTTLHTEICHRRRSFECFIEELCELQPQVLAKDFETIEKLEHLTANLFRVEDCTPQIVFKCCEEKDFEILKVGQVFLLDATGLKNSSNPKKENTSSQSSCSSISKECVQHESPVRCSSLNSTNSTIKNREEHKLHNLIVEPTLEAGCEELVHITYVGYDGKFTVQLQRNSEVIKKLTRDIHDYCNTVKGPEDLTSINAGDVVLAQFHDNQWYRAQVLHVFKYQDESHIEVEVLFFDYGNSSKLTFNKVRIIPAHLMVPKMGLLCCLDNVLLHDDNDRSIKAVKEFIEMTKKNLLRMKVVRSHKHFFDVILYFDGDETIGDILVSLDLARYANPETKLPSTGYTSACYLSEVLPDDSDASVMIVNVSSPDDFYLQLVANQKHIMDMMGDIQKTYSDDTYKYSLFFPTKGMPCIAHSTSSDLWYRAEVLEICRPGWARVRHIDYGSTEIVPFQKLRKLRSEFCYLPKQKTWIARISRNFKIAWTVKGLHCRLANIKPSGNEWDDQSIFFLSNLCSHSVRLYLKIEDVISESELFLSVHLNIDLDFSPEQHINNILVVEGFALPTESKHRICSNMVDENMEDGIKSSPKSCSDLPEKEKIVYDMVSDEFGEEESLKYGKVFISHVVSPDEIYIQPLTVKDQLDRLMNELNSKYKTETSKLDGPWSLGKSCVVCNPNDQKWYRGKVTTIDNDRIQVKMLDYGYQEWFDSSELKPLIKDECFTVSWCSARCHLFDICPTSSDNKWPSDVCNILRSLILNRTCHVSVELQMEYINDSLPVKLFQPEMVPGQALTPHQTVYKSVSKVLISQGLARHTKSEIETLVDFPWADEELVDLTTVAVTYVDSDCRIYVQICKNDLTKLSSLMDSVQNRYKCTAPQINVKWTVGLPVASQFSEDNLFYRARIVGFKEYGIEVQYVDYGNTEVVNKERLRLLDQEFLKIPLQCFTCQLFNIEPIEEKWTKPVIKLVNSIVDGKKCIVQIKSRNVGSHSNPNYQVDLFLPSGESLQQLLCKSGYARQIHEEEEECGCLKSVDAHLEPTCGASRRQMPHRTVESLFKQLPLPQIGSQMYVSVTEVELPNVIYVQHLKIDDQLDGLCEINTHLQELIRLSNLYAENAENYPPLSEDKVKPGQPCVAQFSLDQHWYRAEIIFVDKTSRNTEVGLRFVDYGSCDYVPTSVLREIPAEHLDLPAQSRRCQLDGVEFNKDSDDLISMTKQMVRLFADGCFVAVVKSVDDDNLVVDMFDRENYIQDGVDAELVYQNLINSGGQDDCFQNSDRSIGEDEDLNS